MEKIKGDTHALVFERSKDLHKIIQEFIEHKE